MLLARTTAWSLLFSAAMAACGGLTTSSSGPGASSGPPAAGAQPSGSDPGGPTHVACALPASPTATTVGAGSALETTLATNTASVFWSQGTAGAETVMRAPKTGGGAAVAVPGATGHVAAADDDAVYVVTGAGDAADYSVVRWPLDGGAATTIVSGSTAIDAVAIDDARIYWATWGGGGSCGGGSCPEAPPSLTSAPKTGGAPTTLGAFGARHLHVDGDSLYLDTSDAVPTTSFGSVPKTGGSPVTLATRPNAISDVVLDATNVYWAEAGATAQAPTVVMTMPKSGGTPVTVTTLATRTLPELALDAANVYWLDDQTSSLMRAPKTGGAAVVVVGDQVTNGQLGGFGVLTADATGLYWPANVRCASDCAGAIVMLLAACR